MAVFEDPDVFMVPSVISMRGTIGTCSSSRISKYKMKRSLVDESDQEWHWKKARTAMFGFVWFYTNKIAAMEEHRQAGDSSNPKAKQIWLSHQ